MTGLTQAEQARWTRGSRHARCRVSTTERSRLRLATLLALYCDAASASATRQAMCDHFSQMNSGLMNPWSLPRRGARPKEPQVPGGFRHIENQPIAADRDLLEIAENPRQRSPRPVKMLERRRRADRPQRGGIELLDPDAAMAISFGCEEQAGGDRRRVAAYRRPRHRSRAESTPTTGSAASRESGRHRCASRFHPP